MEERNFADKPVKDHDILENPSPNVETCFKKSEEMKFDVPLLTEHGYCDEIKRGVAIAGDASLFVKPGSFSYEDC